MSRGCPPRSKSFQLTQRLGFFAMLGLVVSDEFQQLAEILTLDDVEAADSEAIAKLAASS